MFLKVICNSSIFKFEALLLYNDWTIFWCYSNFRPSTVFLCSDWITHNCSHFNWVISLLSSLLFIITGPSALQIPSPPPCISQSQVSLCSASAVSHMLSLPNTFPSLTQNVPAPTYSSHLLHFIIFPFLTGLKILFVSNWTFKRTNSLMFNSCEDRCETRVCEVSFDYTLSVNNYNIHSIIQFLSIRCPNNSSNVIFLMVVGSSNK